MQLLYVALAYLAAGVVAYLGYRAHALTRSGTVAACLVGGTIFGLGGLGWAALLVLFFVASSALSFVKASDPRKARAAEVFEKGGRRDAMQVFANGGVGTLLALLVPFASPELLPVLSSGYVGAMAAATADTWATEIGVLSRSQPRLITTGRPVPVGTSGGVTLLGSAASLAGALFIGIATALLAALDLPWLSVAGNGASLLLAAAIGGVSGSLVDSLLGATVQAACYCPMCAKPTESRVHRCGTQARLVGGHPAVTNDVVNLLATLTGALVGGLLTAFG